MSEVSEILEEIDDFFDNEGFGSPIAYAMKAGVILDKTKTLLSSHAVITEKTADLAEVSIMLGAGHGDESVEIRKELTRLSTHKGK